MPDVLTRPLRVLALACVAASASGTANADDTIAICISKEGRVRVVDPRGQSAGHTGPACRRGERLVTLNTSGPPGPPGPAGPQGEPGPAGPGFSGIQYFTVGAGDLRPVGGGAFATAFGPPPGGVFSTAAAPLLAGVHLPQNAQVLALRAHVFDNSAADVTIELLEQELPGGAAISVASVASANAVPDPYSLDAVFAGPHAVDNSRFHYFIRVSPAPGWTATTLQVLGVTVAYTMTPDSNSSD